MIIAIWVLNVFAAFWGSCALIAAGFATWTIVIPLAISAILAFLCVTVASTLPPRDGAAKRRIGRVVGIWSAVEGIAIFLAVNFLQNMNLNEIVVPVVALIVGLHFLPLAHGIPAPLYYATGMALIVVGIAAMLMPPPYGVLAASLGAAVILWTSSVGMIATSRAAGEE